MNKPSNCPNCKGEREWSDIPKRIAMCLFCGVNMRDNTPHSEVKPNICKIFTNVDILRIFEIANEALKDGEQFDSLAEKMELSDAEMRELRDRLGKYMESDAAYLSP